MNKRGQFFLIAAFVIVVIIIGLTLVYNNADAPLEDQSVFDLSEEIDFEAAQVIDNGVFTSQDNEIPTRITELTDHYSEKNPGNDIYLIYGDVSGFKILLYTEEETGTIGIDTGSGTASSLNVVAERKYEGDYDPDENNDGIYDKSELSIKVSNDIEREFELEEGQNFYILVKKEKDDETIVASR